MKPTNVPLLAVVNKTTACAAMRAEATRCGLYREPVCRVADAELVDRPPAVHGTNVPHRDSPALRDDLQQLQFLLVLEGELDLRLERRVVGPHRLHDVLPRRRPVRLRAGQLVVFWGARYAHCVEHASVG